MIYIVYPAGAFGSTIEYCVKRFSKEFNVPDIEISDDGGMHSYFREQYIPFALDFPMAKTSPSSFVTVCYPNLDFMPPSHTITEIKKVISADDRVVFVTLPHIWQAIRNQVFWYFKKVLTTHYPIFNKNSTRYKQWNPGYNSVQDMQRWEQREMLSLEFCGLSDICSAARLKDQSWIVITPDELLNNFSETMTRLITELDLTIDSHDDIVAFGSRWVSKQTYILDHYEKLAKIVDCSINNVPYQWSTLDLVSEALVQYSLCVNGFSLACYGLNKFPNRSTDLYRLLEKIK